MRKQETNESPENITAGLTSAAQLVDTTAAKLFAIENTSSASLIVGAVVTELEPPVSIDKNLGSRKTDFMIALRESVQKNKSAIRELAKY